MLSGILPADRLTRDLVVQSVLSAFSTGAFLTVTAVFFTRLMGLSGGQVGIGLSIASAVGLLASVPLGRLADRVGPQRQWVIGSSVEAALYLLYPVAHGFTAFLLLLSTLALVESGARAGRDAYRMLIFDRASRVRSLAYLRAARNIGYTLGAGAGGIALGLSDTAVRLLPVLTGSLLVVNAVMVAFLPRLHAPVVPQADSQIGGAASGLEAEIAGVPGLRNGGFVTLSFANGILGTNQVLLNVVVPLWLVERTDAPAVLLAWLFGTNTVLAVLLQVPASRIADSVAGCLRAVRWCGWCFVISCGLIMITHETVGWVSIALIWIGHITITGAELFQSASGWGFASELSDPRRMGEYQGVFALGYQAADVVAPAAMTFLALTWGAPGWIVIAAVAIAAVVISHPAARAAQRHLVATGGVGHAGGAEPA